MYSGCSATDATYTKMFSLVVLAGEEQSFSYDAQTAWGMPK
ncbi:hypothetical protein UXO40_23015 [Enterobacter hormaechei]